MDKARDSVFLSEDGYWYFYNETWTDTHGPFATEVEARDTFGRYCHYLDTGEIT